MKSWTMVEAGVDRSRHIRAVVALVLLFSWTRLRYVCFEYIRFECTLEVALSSSLCILRRRGRQKAQGVDHAVNNSER